MNRELRDQINRVLHAQVDVAPPCQTACTHTVWGTWTILGIANVISRVDE